MLNDLITISVDNIDGLVLSRVGNVNRLILGSGRYRFGSNLSLTWRVAGCTLSGVACLLRRCPITEVRQLAGNLVVVGGGPGNRCRLCRRLRARWQFIIDRPGDGLGQIVILELILVLWIRIGSRVRWINCGGLFSQMDRNHLILVCGELVASWQLLTSS